jgi:hypothetical protein
MERGPCVERSGTVNFRNMLKLPKILAQKNTQQNVQNSFWVFRTIFELYPITKRIKSKPGVGALFSNEASLQRLATALLMEICEE